MQLHGQTYFIIGLLVLLIAIVFVAVQPGLRSEIPHYVHWLCDKSDNTEYVPAGCYLFGVADDQGSSFNSTENLVPHL